jgi:DNA-binding CsgD family transcriptional regulator
VYWPGSSSGRTRTRSAIAQLDVGDAADPHVLTSDRVLDYLSGRIGDIRRLATNALSAGREELPGRLREIVLRCEQTQVDLVEMASATDRGPQARFAGLTDTERAVALLLTARLTNEQLAAELGISVNTVKTHLASIRRKYGMSSRADIGADVLRTLR